MNADSHKKNLLVSVVISFFNEEGSLPELISRLRAVFVQLPVHYELIFVNDASTDRSLAILQKMASESAQIKIITMSRRFGVSECVLAGLKYAKGDAAIYLDADLQDPPELIPKLIEKWLRGIDVVYTVRQSRDGESLFKLALTKQAYRFVNFAADIGLPQEAGDYRLISRRVIDKLLTLEEKNPYLRGLVSWVGFRQEPVFYRREKRAAGSSHFPLFKNFFRDILTLHGPAGTFLNGVTSFSTLPLMIFLLTGLLIFGGGVISLLFVLFLCIAQAGPAKEVSLFILLITLFGFQFLGIGVLGLYLGKIYDEVRNRPRYIVESTDGIESGRE